MKRIIISLIAAMVILPLSAPAFGNEGNYTYSQDKKAKKAKKTATVAYQVNMHCKKCVAKLTDNLSFLKGVEDLKISLDEKTVVITYDTSKTDEATLEAAIRKCGYTATKI